MTDTERAALKQQLANHEGRRSKPYMDTTGHLTIGIGHNLTTKGLPDALIDELYELDVQEVIDEIGEAMPWTAELSSLRQRVLIDIAFNTGLNGLLGFHKMLALCQRGDFNKAGDEIVNSALAPARAQQLAAMMRAA